MHTETQAVPSREAVEAALQAIRNHVTARPGLLSMYVQAERAFALLDALLEEVEAFEEGRADGETVEHFPLHCPNCIAAVPARHSLGCEAAQLLSETGVRP